MQVSVDRISRKIHVKKDGSLTVPGCESWFSPGLIASVSQCQPYGVRGEFSHWRESLPEFALVFDENFQERFCMASVPKKVSERLTSGIKRYQPILASAKARDVGETDTVTIIKDMLADVFGYDKYSELTSEYAIRGTFCDLAVKLDGKLSTLIEVKAIGIDLKEQHVKQAVDYAANQGVDWVLLTNGNRWCVYHVFFTRPIQTELVVDIDFSVLNSRSEADIELLYLWCKEGWQRSALGDFHTQKQALSRFFLGAMILTDPVLEIIRRELRRVSPDVRIDIDQIRAVLTSEVIKREVMEGEKAEEAKKKITKTAAKALRASQVKATKPSADNESLPPQEAEPCDSASHQPTIENE